MQSLDEAEGPSFFRKPAPGFILLGTIRKSHPLLRLSLATFPEEIIMLEVLLRHLISISLLSEA